MSTTLESIPADGIGSDRDGDILANATSGIGVVQAHNKSAAGGDLVVGKDVQDERESAVAALAAVPPQGGDVIEQEGGGGMRKSGQGSCREKKQRKEQVRVSSVAEMDKLLWEGKSLFELDARGESQEMLEARQDEHPVLEVLRKRAAAGTVAGSHGDGFKVSSVGEKCILSCSFGIGERIRGCCSCWCFRCHAFNSYSTAMIGRGNTVRVQTRSTLTLALEPSLPRC